MTTGITKRLSIMGALAAATVLCAPNARADYAVLRSGLRLHISGYENNGALVRLTVDGGVVNVPVEDFIAIEPEEHFDALAPEPVALTGPFASLIHAAAQKHGLDEALIARVIAVESNFNPRAVSRKQALGLMQLLPKTAAHYSVINIFDPAQNIDAGTHYLKDLLARYRGNLNLALAAYNAGPEMVERYRGVPPFAETQNYVRQITSKTTSVKTATSKN
jgi:soluble lytic murein transglycosylase-like protein